MEQNHINQIVLRLFENAYERKEAKNQAEIASIDEELVKRKHSPTARAEFWQQVLSQLSQMETLNEAQGAQAFLVLTKQTEEMLAALIERAKQQEVENSQNASEKQKSTLRTQK